MAVVTRNENTDTNEKAKPVFVDLEQAIELGEVRKIASDVNPDDAWGIGAPPPKGFYDLRLQPLGRESVQKKLIDKDDPSKGFYYSANLEFEIVSDNKEANGYTVYSTVSTMLYRGKEISTMAAFIMKCGFPATPKGKAEISDGELVARLNAVSKKQPVIKQVMVNWQGSYQTADGSYKNLFTDYDKFPSNPVTGEKLHEVEVQNPADKSVMTIRARANIQWNVKPDSGLVSMPRSAQAQQITPVAAPAPKAAAPAISVDDLDGL